MDKIKESIDTIITIAEKTLDVNGIRRIEFIMVSVFYKHI